MKSNLTVSAIASLATVVALSLGATGTAQAYDNVTWSVGVSSPGVQLGFTNAGFNRGYVVPAPVYMAPRPVVVAPQVYYPPAQVAYGYPGWGRGGYSGYSSYGGYYEREHFRGHGFRGGERFEHERGGRFEGRGDGHRR